MSINRPTFSESWYRVGRLRPRLRVTIQTFRQHYRGQMWHVVRDPANNQFFRLNDASYFFVALLDGRRTVAEAWDIANKQLGDRAPTQNEVIQLLGQLYGANLLVAEMPADSAALFDRYKKKVRREVQGYLSNLLFVRIPLWDPDHALDRWVSAVGWIFGPIGLGLWVIWLAFAGMKLAGTGAQLIEEAHQVLDPNNLIYLYIATVITKALHELGHGFSCKKFGRASFSGGEVHTIGIMFLVLVPVPYVDASSAWALRNKWQRAVIGAAGMYVELAVAAAAAVIWINTSQGEPIHAIAYNAMFVASVSTLLFNGNPLLRFDGYYILSDLLEIPNLAQRSKDYTYYLVKRYVFGTRHARRMMIGPGERPWLLVYAIAAGIYRVIISVGIIFFIWDKLAVLGALMAIAAVVTWVFVPIGKFMHYLAASDELLRVRPRAVWATVICCAVLVTGIGIIPVTEHARAEGVFEPKNMQFIFALEDGFVDRVLPTGSTVAPDGPPLVQLDNKELQARRRELLAQRELVDAELRVARTQEPALRQVATLKLQTVQKALDESDRRIEALKVRAPQAGRWIAPQAEQLPHRYVRRGERLGLVADVDRLIVRVAADQKLGPRIRAESPVGSTVSVRIVGQPRSSRSDGESDSEFTGVITQIPQTGQRELPSAALGYLGGGSLAVTGDDNTGTKTAEAFFQIVVEPDQRRPELALTGQRVVVRFNLPPRPLAQQWWHALRQLIQRRFEGS